jgi:hypothetical protein
MSHEDRLRAAFDDLDRRVGEVPHRNWSPARRPRFVAALAGAAAVLVVIGGAALFQLLPGEPPTSAPPLTQPTTATTLPPSTTGTTQPPTTTQPGGTSRYRVDTDKVAADTDDPYLNVRYDPSAESPIVAKLPPTYTGLVRAGEITTESDGGEWMRVSLKDPVQILNTETTDDTVVYGWVNTAFVEPLPEGLPVTLAEVPACTGESTGISKPNGSRPPDNIYALESGFVAKDCLRIVLSFGTGPASFDWISTGAEAGPADYLPAVAEYQSRSPYTLDLGDVTSVNPTATDTLDGVYIVRTADLTVQMWVPLPVTGSTVSAFNERGIVVIDLQLDAEGTPPAEALVTLTQQPLISNGSISVTGVTRAFEANLGARIEDENGNPVEALYSGSTFLGTIRTDGYAIQTIDWTEAWAPFALQAEGLEPGDYTLVLDAQGGADDPETLDIPFTIGIGTEESPTEPSATANTAAAQVVGFAQGGSPPTFSETVTIRLGQKAVVSRSRSQMETRQGWVIEAEGFNGYTGPFDILGIIAQRPFVRVSDGVQPRCAGPAIDYWPAAILAYPPVNLEPIGIDSCLQWYRVSLVLGSDDPLIGEVVLDLWEP